MFLPHSSSPLCPCYFCNQDIHTSMDSEPADKAFSHLPSFSGQVQRKTEKGDMRSHWDQLCAPWPQGPECEADGTQTLIQDSHCPVRLFWHFIWIYLFILFEIHLCSQVGNQSTQTEILSRDVLPLSEKGWETKELSHLTDVWKKSYQKAKSLVCLCMLGLWTKFSGYVHIRNNKFTAIYCPVSL